MPRGRSGADRPGAQEWVPNRLSLAALRRSVQDCRGCELYEGTTQAVLGAGRADAPLMLVGEQPGDREDVEGKPFVGPAGRLLDKALQAAEIAPELVFRTNAVKHFRFTSGPGKRRMHQSPDLSHMRACAPWLSAELTVVKPRGVVLLGATAGKAIFGSSFRVTIERGHVLSWPDDRAESSPPDWVVATIHPSAVLRADDRDAVLQGLVADLVVAREALAG
ncbi:MAG TPA: UdgX family uracil-DNA binding protein [Nocardioidaceae bacterium]|jgi:DNA polymerase